MKITFRRRQYRTTPTSRTNRKVAKVSTKVMIAARSARFIETIAVIGFEEPDDRYDWWGTGS